MTSSEQIKEIIKDAIEELRQTSFVPFWKPSIEVTPSCGFSNLFHKIGMDRSDVKKELEKVAAKNKFKTFDLIISDGSNYTYGDIRGLSIYAKLKDGAEWDAALRDAWRNIENPNEWFLSDNAVRMLAWLQSPKNTGDFSPQNKIGSQAGLRGSGSYSEITTYWKEISLKSPYQVTFEPTRTWRGKYKATIKRKDKKPITDIFINPCFSGKIHASDPDSVRAYTQMLKDGVMATDLEKQAVFFLFKIHSRSELIESLPEIKDKDKFSPYEFEKFLGKVRLTPGLNIGATLSDDASEGWRVGAVLEEGWTWERARNAITEQRNRKDPVETYGLSLKAAKIFEWILDLREDELELDMTPIVEDKAVDQIGIEDLAHNQNSGAFIRLLIEEINQKTFYSLKLIPWKHYNREEHRILVHRDKEGNEDLVRKIQIRALDKGIHLKTSQVEQALDDLWQSGSSCI